MIATKLFSLTYALTAALAAGSHDDLTAGQVLELAGSRRLLGTLMERLGTEPFSYLTSDEADSLVEEWANQGDYDIAAFGLISESRGLGVVLLLVLQRLDGEVSAAELAVPASY